MKKTIVLSLLVSTICSFGSMQAQNNQDSPVLITIDGEKVLLDEFVAVYKKNSNNNETKDETSVKEYLDLFINYKLKVKEAEKLGMDTASKFVNELGGYRKQLIQPYLIDREMMDQLTQEAYDRLQYDINVSHILLRVASNAAPADTLSAYNKIMTLRKRILSGEDFAKVAEEIAPGSNGGNLGYFTALQMMYPFETAAYNTKVGDVSLPTRTSLGYHIIKVNDKRKAVGQIHVAHIFIKANEKMNEQELNEAKQKIDVIYQKVQKGDDFAELAMQFSEDKSSANKGGMLNWFGVDPTKGMLPEFETASFALANDNDISAPVRTNIGWHIIKRIGNKGTEENTLNNPELKMKVNRDSRSLLAKQSLINKIKKNYGYKLNAKTLSEFYKVVDASIFENKWTADKASHLTKVMFTLTNNIYGKVMFALTDNIEGTNKNNYTQQDFASYLEKNQGIKSKDASIKAVVDMLFDKFVEGKCLQYEEALLESKYPEFKTLLNEYRDGILLFELSDKRIWSKAITDTVGLEVFYGEHTNDFMWNQRLNATIYTCKDAVAADKTKKLLAKKDKKGYSHEDIKNMINKETPNAVSIETKVYQKNDNELVDNNWLVSISDNVEKDGKTMFVVGNQILNPTPKTLDEAKGLVTSAYQKYLETEWLKELKAKYPVEVFEAVLNDWMK